MKAGNIFEGAAPPGSGERFDRLLTLGNLVVERIVSSEAIERIEYRQTQHEWVVLLKGEARIDVAGTDVSMKSGDYLFLEAETPHTVLQVSEGAVWLGIHLHPEGASPSPGVPSEDG